MGRDLLGIEDLEASVPLAKASGALAAVVTNEPLSLGLLQSSDVALGVLCGRAQLVQLRGEPLPDDLARGYRGRRFVGNGPADQAHDVLMAAYVPG